MAVILILAGGIMVIFLYITSLRNNLAQPQTKKNALLALLIFLIRGWETREMANCSPLALISEISSLSLAYLIFYLILTLLLVTKITQSFKGALTQKFF